MGTCLSDCPFLDFINPSNWVAFYRRVRKRELGPVLYDRKSGTLIREKLPLETWIENAIMYSRPLDVIDQTGFIRKRLKSENIHSEHRYNKYASARKIGPFVDFFDIDMKDFVIDNPQLYATFNEFFIREVKSDKRPIAAPDDDSVIVSAADCRLTVFDTVRDAHRLFIKGKSFSLDNLLSKNLDPSQNEKADKMLHWVSENCSMVNFRLSPMDYHRFHSPVSGTVASMYHIGGEYYTTEPMALESDVDILGENSRSVVSIETENRGNVIFIPIGAEAVGKITLTVQEGDVVQKGQVIGYFDYGGSDIVAIFERSVEWDADVRERSYQGIETLLHVNERIGNFV